MTHTPTSAEIASAVKNRLREAGISHQEAAAALGIERATLNRRLNAHRPLNSDDLAVLAHLLGITIAELVTVGGEAA